MTRQTLIAALCALALGPSVTFANRIEDLSKDDPSKAPAAAPAAASPILSAPVMPAAASAGDATTDSFVVSIYGRGVDNLTAEIVDQRQLVIAKAGTVLPSGFVVKSVNPNAVTVEKSVTKGKKTTLVTKQLWMPTADSVGVGGSIDFSGSRLNGNPMPLPMTR